MEYIRTIKYSLHTYRLNYLGLPPKGEVEWPISISYNGDFTAMTPGNLKQNPPSFNLSCLVYGRVLIGTIFNAFGITQKVSSSLESVIHPSSNLAKAA